MKVAVKVRDVQHAAKSRDSSKKMSKILDVSCSAMGGYYLTSDLICAFCPHSLEVELPDLGFLAGRERQRRALWIRHSGNLAGGRSGR